MNDKGKFHFSEKTKRNFKYGSNSIILIIVVMVVAIVLNIVLEQFPIKFDLTTQKLFSITDTTKKVMNNLNKDVEINCLFDRTKGEGDKRKIVIQVLDHYKESNKIKVTYVDILKNPKFLSDEAKTRASEYTAGDYMVKCGNNIKRIAAEDMFEASLGGSSGVQIDETGLKTERLITSAILYVTSDTIPAVYFSTGNLEVGMEAPFSTFKRELEVANFDVKSVNLTTEDMPSDAAIIIFNSPQQDLSKIALDKLTSYFENGGNAFFFIDPLYNGNNLVNFNTLLTKFNIQINNDMVNDSAGELKGQTTKFLADTISKGPLESVKPFLVTILDSRSLNTAKTNSDLATSEILVQSKESASSNPILSNEGIAIKGIQKVVVSGIYTGGLKNAKVLVSGSSQFINDATIAEFNEYSGINIVKYASDWMFKRVNEGDLIEIKKTQTQGLKPTTKSEGQALLIICVVAIPFAIFITGGVVWFRRRHL